MRGDIDNRIDRIRHETHAGCVLDGDGQAIIRLPLHSSEVTIILTDITLPLPLERLALLTAADLEYADRFSNAGRRAANLTWRAALRSAIREGIVPGMASEPRSGSSPEAYAGADIEYSPCGAPFIAGNPFRFGVSHTSDKAALIIADTPCAIDIERADRDFSRVAARILTDRERQLAAECPIPNATGLMWCAKETIYKLSGSGIDFRHDIAIEQIDPVTRTIDGRLSVGGHLRMIRLHYRSSVEHLIVFAADNI